MQSAVLSGGFVNAPIDAANAFRSVMTALANPGRICSVSGAQPPQPLSIAAGVIVLTLCDPETPVYLGKQHDTQALRDWITFHTGAPILSADQAMFGIGHWCDLPVSEFNLGTSEYPDRSSTLIVEMSELENQGATLRGPGIKDAMQLSLPELPAFQANAAHFPLGLDFMFTCQDHLAGLPRTTRVG